MSKRNKVENTDELKETLEKKELIEQPEETLTEATEEPIEELIEQPEETLTEATEEVTEEATEEVLEQSAEEAKENKRFGRIVNCELLNARKEPNVNSEVIEVLRNRDQDVIEILDEVDNFYKVLVHNKKVYCMKKYIAEAIQE